MKLLSGLILLVLTAQMSVAQTASEGPIETAAELGVEVAVVDATDTNLSDFLWAKRPVVVFADTPADPAFQRQLDLLTARLDVLADRDVIIVTDTDPDAKSDIRLKLRPRGFMLALIGKDGQVELRKPLPWDVRELSRVIDKMPLRQQELRERRAAKSNLQP